MSNEEIIPSSLITFMISEFKISSYISTHQISRDAISLLSFPSLATPHY